MEYQNLPGEGALQQDVAQVLRRLVRELAARWMGEKPSCQANGGHQIRFLGDATPADPPIMTER